jgi:hypothetical protein
MGAGYHAVASEECRTFECTIDPLFIQSLSDFSGTGHPKFLLVPYSGCQDRVQRIDAKADHVKILIVPSDRQFDSGYQMDADLFRSDGRFFNPVGCIVIGQGQKANAFFGCAPDQLSRGKLSVGCYGMGMEVDAGRHALEKG